MQTAVIGNFHRGCGKTNGYLILAMLCATMMALPSFAARTVAISAYDDATREVSLSFGGSSSAAENVYLAYGSSDCGGHFHKWPNSVNIGTVAADATSMTYTLPAAITAGTYYRFFVGDCPYDAELEYIKGDKTSWILTSYVPSSTNKVETEVFFDTIKTGNDGIEAIYSARNTSAKRTFTTLQSGGNLRIDRKDSTSQESTTIKIPTLTHYTISVDYSAETIKTNLTSACGMKTGSAGAYTAGGYLALFTINGNGFNVNENSPIERGGGFRMYWFKMYNTATGNLDLDLIPVVVGGSPCMYDRVSGNVLPRYGAAGGAFTAGRELSVAVASSQTCLFGGTIAVDSVNFSTGEITLSFPSLPTNATIWAVYATNTDIGVYSPNGWDHYVKAADVAAGETSATFTLQDLAGVSDSYQYKALRFVMAWDIGKTTPYDYQIEYIYAMSPNYVDTGIVPYSTDSAAAKVNVRSSSGNWPVWSARSTFNSRTFSCLATNGKKFRFDRNNSYSTTSGTFNLNEDYILEADYKTRIYEVTGNINGDKYGLFTAAGDFTPGSSLYLFAANNNGSVGADSYLYLYWFTLQLYDDSLRRDLIPVVKDGAACLYDKVTDAIMTQSGSFTAGARTAQRFGMDAIMTSDLCIDTRTAEAPAYARMVSDGNAYSWHFYNLELEEIANPSISLPDATTTVIFCNSGEIAAVIADRTANGWTAGGYRLVNFAVTSDNDAIAGVDGLLFDGATIDLAGHTFTLPAMMRDSGVAFTVTNSTAGTDGALTVDVPSGAVFTNDFIALSGNLKLVKTGAGEFVASKTGQTYSGGTEVVTGVLSFGTTVSDRILGAEGSTVTASSDSGAIGVIEINGFGDFYQHPFVLDGGTMRNSKTDIGVTIAQVADIRLESNSTLGATNSWGLIGSGYAPTTLDLGGNTLAVGIGLGKYFYLSNAEVKNGSVDVVSGGYFQTGRNGYATANGENVATNVDFRIGSALRLYAPLSVRNYEAAYGFNYNSGTAALNVYGVFKPSAHDYFYGCTMQNGSTIDLSARTNALPFASASTSGANTLGFAENATVTIDLSGRADLAVVATSAVPYVATWTVATRPSDDVTFVLDADSTAAGYSIKRDEHGIVLANAAAIAAPFYARLVKPQGEDAYSWSFYNSFGDDITAAAQTAGTTMPDSTMTVLFDSAAELSAIAADRTANGWSARGYHTGGFDVPCDNYDISDMNSSLVISENATIDLKGHDFTLPASLFAAAVPFTVTDSSPAGEGGALTIDNPDADTVIRNTFITFSGSLKLVKTGVGLITASKAGQTYSGGTLVSGGMLKLGYNVGAFQLGAGGSTVTVGPDGTLDMNGQMGFGDFTFILAGGTLSNDGAYSTSFTTTNSIGSIRLTADSSIVCNGRYGIYREGEPTFLDLGGHTLTIRSGTYFDLISTTVENGTIIVEGTSSAAMLLPRQHVVATNNVTFVIRSNMNFYTDIFNEEMKNTDLLNYVAQENQGISGSSHDVLRIWGAFTPCGTKYHGLTMMDGSTLDLSQVNVELPTLSTLSGNVNLRKLKFADNATIYVNVGDRPLHKGDYLVTWTAASKPANLDTVKFLSSGDRSFRVEVDEDGEGTDGLRFIPTGFLMIVR